MSKDVYKELLEVMKKRGGGYAGMDIPEFYAMVEELFTPEEAEVNNALPRGPVTAKDLAKEMGKDEAEIEKILEAMADKGLCVSLKFDDNIPSQANGLGFAENEWNGPGSGWLGAFNSYY